MIKFFKGTYDTVSGQISGANNIVFVTNRNTLYMGGEQYGKDQFKAVATADLAATSAIVPVGAVVFDKTAGILYQKTGAETLAEIQNVPQNIADLKEAISATISTAFVEGKVTIGTTTGVTASDFVLDTTSGNLASVATPLSTTLVNAATLSAAVTAINQAAAHVEASSGVTVLTGTPDANGTLYTVGLKLGDSISSSLKYDSASGLVDDLYIEKLTTPAATGYAASYVLKNGKGTQLGDTINIAKGQLLKSASYVYGTEAGGVVTEITAGSQTAASNRYLKLVFWTDSDHSGTEDDGQTTTTYINVNELFDSYSDGNGITVDNSTNTIAVKVDENTETDGTNAYLTVGASGLKVAGINAAISAQIQALGQTDAATTDYFVTQIGVNATDDTLTASFAKPFASGVTFAPTGNITATDVQGAIAELESDVADLISGLDVDEVGDNTTYIQKIKQEDGKIVATSATLDAEAVAYSTTAFNVAVTNVSGAIDNIHNVISGLDYAQTAAGTAPAAGAATKYTIVNTVGEVDGKISATTLDLTAANTYAVGITENLGTSNAPIAADTARVAITQGTQDHVNDQFSNILADFLSFHDGTGKVI